MFLKGKKGKQSQLITEVGGKICGHIPLHAGLLTPCELSLDAISFTQSVHEISEGEAGEKI